MRIAIVNTEAWRGGAAKMAVTLTRALAEKEENVCLYHASDRKQEPFIQGLRRFGSYNLNVLFARMGGSMMVYDFGLAQEILNLAANADILHIHNLHGYYLDYQKLLYGWRDRPIVWTWHDQWGSTGRCAFPDKDCNKWLTGCGQCPSKQVYPVAWLDRSSHEFQIKSDIYRELKKLLIVTPCEWLRQIAIDRGFDPSRVQVIPNPVMLNKFRQWPQAEARKHLRLALDKPLLLFVASDCNDPRKGYYDFERLANKLDATAVVVGKPPGNLSSRIHYTGSIEDSDTLSAYYSAADLLVMTTQADNYPNVIIEAMACGTPVVSYKVGGIPDQMPSFWNGLVSFNDQEALLYRCQEVLKDTTQLASLRDRFRDHALASWQPKIVAQRYIDAYHTAINFI
jgi:putative colanic acid biosynthesis glycosyltransferase